MAFNGSGTFLRLYSWANDKAAAIKIRADRMDNEMNGFATGLSNCITRDGQSPATANIPMGGFKITGLANGTNSTDAVAFGQISGLGLPAVTTETGNRTLALTDAGDIIRCTSGSAQAITIPAEASVAFSVGDSIRIIRAGAGAVTITGDTGVTVNGTSAGSVSIQLQYRSALITKVASDNWIAEGTIL